MASALIQGESNGSFPVLDSDFHEVVAPEEIGANLVLTTRTVQASAGGFTATARSEQASSFGLVSLDSAEISSIQYAGLATRNVSPPDDPADSIYPAPGANGTFSVQFIVDVETPYTLTGSATGSGDWSASISFGQLGSSSLLFAFFPPGAPFQSDGMLSPGVYEISVSNSAGLEGDATNTGELNFLLTFAGGADQIRWNTLNGSFEEPTNWDPQKVPADTDTAIFEVPGAYSVNVGTHTIERLRIGDGPSTDVTFTNSNLAVQATSLEDPSVEVDNGNFTLASGDLNSVHSVIGSAAATNATVTGSTAKWSNQGRLTVGAGGEANLDVKDGATVESAESRIGDATNGAFGTAAVSGSGSQWDAGALAVGLQSEGTLSVLGGGKVNTSVVEVGGSSTADGDVFLMGTDTEGTSATLSASGDITIGKGGPGVANVVDGGSVVALGDLAVGDEGTGELFVRGEEGGVRSLVVASRIFMGSGGTGTIVIEEGGQVLSEGIMEIGATGSSGAVTVDGAVPSPSELTVQGQLFVGNIGEGTLDVTNGGLVDAERMEINGAATVNGVNGDSPSKLTTTENLVVGGVTDAGELRVQAGGDVRVGPGPSSEAALFVGSGESGTVIVTGGNGDSPSAIVVSDSFEVGFQDQGQLTIEAGGLLLAFGSLSGVASTGLGGPGAVVVSGSAGDRRSELTAPTLDVGTGDTHLGTVAAENGGWVHLFEKLDIRATGTVDTRTGAVTISEDENFAPMDGFLRIGPGGTLAGSGLILAPTAPAVAGGVLNFGGIVQIGASPGRLTIEGDYAQEANGTLVVEIGGLLAGQQYDVLDVSRDVTLGGELILRFINGFAPQQGEEFAFLEVAGASAGAFANARIENLEPGFDSDLAVVEGAWTLTALNDGVFDPTVDSDGDTIPDVNDNCPAVANGPAQDNQVDADGDGTGNACECGDFNLDGRVTTVDARLIQRCVVGQIECAGLCDVTGDGACTTVDARLIQRLAVQQLTKDDLSCAARP